jgi:PAS domain S-box-containing protein
LTQDSRTFAFLDGGGEMGALMGAYDWSTTPLGLISTWPQSLKTACGILLRSPVPIVMLWGEDGIMIYNDAYSVFAGGRHPQLLGSKVREGWPEVADFNDNIMKVVLGRGETIAYKAMELQLNRRGQLEPAWMDLDYSPVPDESGQPAGVIAIVVEITEKVMAERRLNREHGRLLQLFEQAPSFICTLRGPDHVFEFVNAAHRRLFGSADWVGQPLRVAFPGLTGQGYFEIMDRVYQTGERYVANGVPVRFASSPHTEETERLLDFVYEAMREDDGAIVGVFCEGYDVTDQRRAEVALKDSEQRLQLALDAAQMGAFIWHVETDTTEGDARMMALFGLPEDGLLTLKSALTDSILPEDGAVHAAAITQACDPQGTGVLSNEIRVRHPDGSIRWLDITGRVYFEGEPRRAVRMVGAARDVTAARQAAAALRDSEARLRFLDDLAREAAKVQDADAILSTTCRRTAEHLGVSICAYADMDEDQDGFTIRGDWAAPGSTSIVGHYSLADFGKQAVSRLGAGLPLIVNDIPAELAPEEAATFQAIGIWATICMPLVKEGKLTALMAIHSKTPRVWSANELSVIGEVTERSWAHIERVRVEAELRASEANFRTLARAMPNQAWTSPPDGQLDWFNDQVYAYSGLKSGELEGAGWTRMVHPDDLPHAGSRWGEALARGDTYETEFRLRRHDGVWRWHIARAVPIKSEGGQVLRWIGTNTDIHDQKVAADTLADLNATLEQRVQERTSQLMQAEEALVQSQKMETVGQLTGGVAHDFNNLLTPIVGALDMLRSKMEGDPRAQRLTEGALQAADRAQTLVQRLLAFSRRQHLMPQAVDVRGLIEGMTDLVSRSLGPRIQLNLVLADALPPAHVDPNQLELALLNLAVNARDAMAGEGELTIRADTGLHDGKGPYLRIAVSDTGVGMDAATLKRAIEPFFTTKEVGRGTGLGLSSVQGLAVQSGGAFELTSRPGKGTTAILWLPVSSETVKSKPVTPAEMPQVQAAAGCILLVDDEDLVRSGTADMLMECGYAVKEARSGGQAVQMLKDGLAVDLLITDYAMPAMTGAELAGKAREVSPDLPILMITGYATLSDQAAGGLPRLAKPFRQSDLAAAVAGLMEAAVKTPA